VNFFCARFAHHLATPRLCAFDIYRVETNAEKIKQTAFEVLLQKTDSKDKKKFRRFGSQNGGTFL
jgi:hypothetical protein